MVEVIFKIDGIEKTEMAIFDTIKEMRKFIKEFKEEVLATYPNATEIRLGKCYTSI